MDRAGYKHCSRPHPAVDGTLLNIYAGAQVGPRVPPPCTINGFGSTTTGSHGIAYKPDTLHSSSGTVDGDPCYSLWQNEAIVYGICSRWRLLDPAYLIRHGNNVGASLALPEASLDRSTFCGGDGPTN